MHVEDSGNGEAGAAEHLALYRTLLSTMSDGVFFADHALNIHAANPAFKSMTGLDRETLPAGMDAIYPGHLNAVPLANARAALAAVGYWSGELARTDARGSIRIDELSLALATADMRQAPALSCVGLARDVTRQREAEERMAWARNHDELTGLPDRSLFIAALDAAISRAGEKCDVMAVVAADLDNFKRFNTDFGHDEGDSILKAAADRLRSRIRPGDFVARTGGDEFSVIVNLRNGYDAINAAEDVRDAFLNPLETESGTYKLRASIGVAICPGDGMDGASLMAAADLAMQECKHQGKDGVMCFDQDLYRQRGGQALMEAELREAIGGNSLTVAYQPIVRIADGMIAGVEALVRWNHPERGDIAPDRFVPLAEETGLILGLGELVLRSACAQGAIWARGISTEFRIAVNVSPVQVERPDFSESILKALEVADLRPDRLVLEITENVLLARTGEARLSLARLKNLGISISVDDYGTGYSSLAYVKDLPVDSLKIDKSFVREMDGSSVAREIVSGTVSMAHRMGLKVVAEGVESAEQFYLLRSMGCDFAQGYLFGKALPPGELEGRYLHRGGSQNSSFLFR